jgi:hypothetical protein
MTTTRRPVTAERHAEIGLELCRIHEEIGALFVEVANTSGTSKPLAKALDRVHKALAHARSVGDDTLAREHPTAFAPEAYYPRLAGGALPSR